METPRRQKPLQLVLGTPQVGSSPSSGDSAQQTPKRLEIDSESKTAITLSSKLVETKQLWHELCEKAKVDNSKFDEHSAVFVNSSILTQFGLVTGDLVEISLAPGSLDIARFRTVLVLEADVKRKEILISPLLWFNLRQRRDARLKPKILLQKKSLPDEARLELIGTPWAAEVHITLITSHYYTPSIKLTQALALYFSKRRRLCLDDIIVIPRDVLEGEEYIVNLTSESPVVFYKITKISSANRDENTRTDDVTFLVNTQQSNLIQAPGTVSQTVPLSMQWFLSNNPPGPYWRQQPLPGLHEIHNQLCDVIVPYILTNIPKLPATILLMGQVGIGKFSVVRAVAVQLGLHLLKINCHDLCGDSAAATEARIRNLFSKAQACTPSILLMENFDTLGRDKDSYDVRVAATFTETVRASRDNTHPPLIIIATSSLTKLDKDMTEVFLHEFTIQTPTEVERKEILAGLLGNDPVSNVDLPNIAKHTAGMVLGDLVALLSTAKLNCHHKFVVENYGAHCCPDWNEEKCLSKSKTVALDGADIDDALHQLQTRHADSLGAPKIPNVSWDDVGGLEDIKTELLDTIQLPLDHPELFAKNLRRSGVLLYGPPGSGKTLLAKAVATECSLNFLSVKGPELINAYVGQSEENIRDVFSRARSAAPCVVFFDELDSLAPNRGRTGDSGGVMDRIVSQLLAELDGLDSKKDVFVIGATNRPDLLDPALTRPGRFDKLLYLGVPGSSKFQLKILQALTRKFILADDVDLKEVADKCPLTLTGADLYGLCADAMMENIRRQIHAKERDEPMSGPAPVTMNDFTTALSSIKPSVSEEELVRYRNMQQKTKTKMLKTKD